MRFRVTETWSNFVTVEAETPEEAFESGKELLHNGEMDDAEYHGSRRDGVELLNEPEDKFKDEYGLDKTFWEMSEL